MRFKDKSVFLIKTNSRTFHFTVCLICIGNRVASCENTTSVRHVTWSGPVCARGIIHTDCVIPLTVLWVFIGNYKTTQQGLRLLGLLEFKSIWSILTKFWDRFFIVFCFENRSEKVKTGLNRQFAGLPDP